jgi:bifunctional non-homologous end joining protein LigD
VSLETYRKKRDFTVTDEPSGSVKKASAKRLQYVIQKHRATALHYDFRLEWNGVLLSWAVPKGPSLDPSVKRLAMQVEDHPVEYGDFEGGIPEGQYGGGTVMVWDRGEWESESPDVNAALAQGDLKFELYGKKLRGSWVLVRTKGGYGRPGHSSWLLIKHKDEYATGEDIVAERPESALSGKMLAEIAAETGGDVEKAKKADLSTKQQPQIPAPMKRSSRTNDKAVRRAKSPSKSVSKRG